MNKEALVDAKIECFSSYYIQEYLMEQVLPVTQLSPSPHFASSMAATKELIEIADEVHLVRVSLASPSPFRSPSLSSVVVHDRSVLY